MPVILILLSICLAHADPTQADGSRMLSQSVAALSQGNAFVAQTDDPSAIYYNPAGMTQVPGVQFMNGIYFVNSASAFRRTQSNSGGMRVLNSFLFFLPSVVNSPTTPEGGFQTRPSASSETLRSIEHNSR